LTKATKIPAINSPHSDAAPVRASETGGGRLRERCILVHLNLRARFEADAVEEFRRLAESAGAQVCAVVSGARATPEPATFVGRGKAEELRQLVAQHEAGLVLVNHAISPVQERNLERLVGCRVLDRTGLILDIFAQRASSHEGKLQVELAQLRHLSTRLVRGWTHLERQKGGIGLRGPGETQLETDRRLIGARIKVLRSRLGKVHSQRALRRRTRRKVPIPTVSLVGYTNAGKSSLFNRLTDSAVYEADQLFATLDPTMRRLRLDDAGDVILTDTVGFIRHLPHGLIESFKSTLEEVAEAALLLHVIDVADPNRRENARQVEAVLAEIGAENVPRITVYNKIDRESRPPAVERDADGRLNRVWVSAHTGAGIDLLLRAMAEHFRGGRIVRELFVPMTAGRARAMIHQRLTVLEESVDDAGDWSMTVEMDDRELGWIEKFSGEGVRVDEPQPASLLAQSGASP